MTSIPTVKLEEIYMKFHIAWPVDKLRGLEL